jgi:hypothetical protein
MKFLFPNFKIKGQSAIEFVIIVTAVLFLFVGFLYFVYGKISESKYESISAQVNEVALTVQDEINLASNSPDGYFRTFFIPLNIAGNDYQINILENSVYVRTDDGRHAVALPVSYVVGDVYQGTNSLYKLNDTVFLN